MKPEKGHQMQYNYSSLPLHTGSLKILTGRGLRSVLILYKNILCKETLGQSTLFQVTNTLNKVQCQLVTYIYVELCKSSVQ